jgi:hypothetical protein
MATVNEIFIKAKEHLRSIAGDAVEIMAKKSDKVRLEIEDNTQAVEKSGDNIQKAIKNAEKAISGDLKGVQRAIESQEVAESVNIKNPEAITGDLKDGLEGIISTLKEEIKNFDKEVVVKNDLGQLATLFKSTKDKKDVVQALSKVETAIKNIKIPEPQQIKDTSDLLVRLIEATSDRESLSGVLEEIRDKEFSVGVVDVNLDPKLVDNDRIRTILPDDQISAMSGVATSNSTPIVEAINNLPDNLDPIGIKNSIGVAINPATADAQVDGSQKTQVVGGDETVADVITCDGHNGLVTISPGHVSTDNSTSTPLSADGVFTGTSEDTLNFGVIIVTLKSDVASATNGLSIQFSSDGTNWDCTDAYTIPAGVAKTFSFQVCERYMRVVYTNGGSDQTYLRLQTQLKPYYVKPSSHRIQDSIVGEDDAELVKAVSTGLAPDGTFKNVLVTNSGNQKISIEELESGISSNSNSQLNVTLFDEGGIPASVDDSTETLQTIEYEHHEIHSGSHFNYCDYQTGVGLNGTIEFVMTVPDTTEWPHLAFLVFSSTGALIDLYEGTTGVSGGTSITPRNNNRNSSHTSTVTLVKDPASITSDGTRASGYVAGAGRTAGFAERNRELVLKRNTAYLVRITSTAASNTISWCAEWYEHIDKN